MAELNFPERIGLEFLRRRIDRAESHVHEWSDSELAEIQRIERRSKIVAAAAGAVSGTIIGLVEILLGMSALDLTEPAAWSEQLPSWWIFAAVTLLVSGAELLVLYGYALRAVARISSIAGLCLSAREVEQLIAAGLSRAALEMPNPRQPIHGIDPYARVPRWKLAVYSILYRIKVGVTSFILRVVLRRVLSRAAVRVFVPLVAIPVFAIWNAMIARWVMREVRLRVAGPLAVQQLGERAAEARAKLDAGARRLIMEALAEAIVRGEDAHPNYALLLARLFEDLAISPDSLRLDWRSQRAELPKLEPKAQDLLLTIVTAAVILNSRVRKAQRTFLAEAFGLCRRRFRSEIMLDLRRELINGRGLGDEDLSRLLG